MPSMLVMRSKDEDGKRHNLLSRQNEIFLPTIKHASNGPSFLIEMGNTTPLEQYFTKAAGVSKVKP